MTILFSFAGRIGRGGWWLGILSNIVCLGGALAIAYLVFGAPMSVMHADGTSLAFGDQPGPDDKFVTNAASIAVIAAGYLLSLWISIATAVKRLHDRGKSGWWFLLMAVLSVIVVGSIWMLIELGILEGQKGPNAYGPDPRAPGTASAA